MKDLVHKKLPIKYTEIIFNIDGKNMTLEEIPSKHNGDKKVFCMRHDVDILAWFDFALKIAELEYSHGIRSTYCIRKACRPDKFYSKGTIYYCKKLTDLGHNINLHLDIIDVYIKTNEKIRDLISKPLNFLRENGIKVEGVSAHGTPNNYIYGFNYEFWNEFDPNRYQGIGKLKFDKVSLSDFGLTYETTFIGHDAYLSDKQLDFFGYLTKDFDIIPFDSIAYKSKQDKGLEIINIFNKMDKGFFQVNIHPSPERWDMVE